MFITSPDEMCDDQIFQMDVVAKYANGMPLKGTATVRIFNSYNFHWSENESDPNEKTITIDGKGTVEFDMKKALRIDENYECYFNCQVDVTEDLTGITKSIETPRAIYIYKTPYKITDELISEEFEPEYVVSIKVHF